MATVTITGGAAIDRTLRDLPRNIRNNAIRSAARLACKPIIRKSKRILETSASSNNQEGQSKLAYIARNIKAVNLKSRENPGAFVVVKGNDLPVGDRFWDVRSYAILLGEGSYKAGVRRTRKTGASRGRFRGFGNFIEKAASLSGSRPTRIFMNGIHIEVQKALTRSIKRG